MALFPPGPLVKGPRPSAPRRFGLLDVVQPVTPQDPHWVVGGVNWEDFLCSSTISTFLDTCPGAPSGFTKTGESEINFCSADPFQVLGSFDCSVGGRVRQYKAGEAFEIARQRLLNWEGFFVEQAFWTGIAANGGINPSLAFGNSTCGISVTDLTPGGGPIDPVGAIATLEDALTEIVPNGGIIHVPYGLAAYLANFMLLDREGDRMYTPTGNSYVLGSGYPGSGPANVAATAGTTWIFATGPVGVWQSAISMVPNELSEAVDRSVNDVTVFAEKYFAVGFSCAVLAINVDLTCTCA